MNDVQRGIDLSTCDLEPIHVPGSIQPHGAVMVIDAASNRVAFASANIGEYLKQPPESMIGKPLSEIIGGDLAHQIGNAAAKSGYGRVAGVILNAQLQNVRADISIHKHAERLFIEFELPASPGDAELALSMSQTLMRRLDKDTEVDDLTKSAARLVRALLGFDRVMVYRFLHNGTGCVVAESKAPGQATFLGQHFPSSDIPVQARKLYVQNWTRLIADASFEPVPLVPSLKTGETPVDLSFAHLRSVSPVHCEYLRNMGVRASTSISVVVGGELWGLIACHHDEPKFLSIPLRVAIELFAQHFSLQITTAENRLTQRAASYARLRLDAIAETVDVELPIETILTEKLTELSSLIACDGAGVWANGSWTAMGAAPERRDVLQIIETFRASPRSRIWSTQDLRSLFPDTRGFGTKVAGALGIPVSAADDTYFLLFRREEAYEIEWAGQPGKQTISSPRGERLTPRTSFEMWRELVKGRSNPWSDDQRTVAESIRSYLRDIVTGQSDALREQRGRVEQQRELLNAELNHRNKNVLALVKSIATQTGVHSTSIDEFARSFEGRLTALSHAHDLSFAKHDGGELRALIDAETNMHHFVHLPDRFLIDGPPVGLSEHAFGVFSLVLHEMMTNAAKYGSLSLPSARLEISWGLDQDGDCLLFWKEMDGPLVSSPTRKGFGSTLIEKTISFDLGGTVDLEYAPSGLIANFRIPAKHLHPIVALPIQELGKIVLERPLAQMCVLLVEDQALIAMDMEEMLRGLGAAEVLTSPSVAHALISLTSTTPNIAILDFNLRNETSEAVAENLIARAIPFIFSTGYRDGTGIPPEYEAVPVVTKPVSLQALAAGLARAGYSSVDPEQHQPGDDFDQQPSPSEKVRPPVGS
jgi:light-regulated signal transduction histidine kinase (bacteriophytochrome)/CheY-like chemotaxis protein